MPLHRRARSAPLRRVAAGLGVQQRDDGDHRGGEHERAADGDLPPRDWRDDRLARPAAAYDCLAVQSRFDTGAIGTPFRLVVHFDTGRFAWCEIIPLGDRDRLSHPLPDACRL